jgi:hypothetical protein
MKLRHAIALALLVGALVGCSRKPHRHHRHHWFLMRPPFTGRFDGRLEVILSNTAEQMDEREATREKAE